MKTKHIVVALMILTLLQACSLIHEVFRMNEVSAPQKQVIRRPIPREQPTPQNPPAKITELAHTYMHETVNSARTRQFIITEMPIFLKPPERALKVKLKTKKVLKSLRDKITKPMFEKAGKQEKPAVKHLVKTFTVSFPINSSFLPGREAGKLDQVMEVLKNGHAVRVDVTGYTCWLGSKKYNRWLALRRAKTVALRLKKAGLKIRSVSGKGKCCYIDQKNPAPNRRVEITYSPDLQGGLRTGRREGGDAL